MRVAYSLDAALPVKNALEAVNLAEHLLNIVDIPKGAVKENPAPHTPSQAYNLALHARSIQEIISMSHWEETPAYVLPRASFQPGCLRKL